MYILLLQVLDVDVGRHREIRMGMLMVPDGQVWKDVYEVPAYFFECALAEIQPAVSISSLDWSKEATKFFIQVTAAPACLLGEVYSVVDGVVRMKLRIADQTRNDITWHVVNQMLVDRRLAEPSPEGYMSTVS